MMKPFDVFVSEPTGHIRMDGTHCYLLERLLSRVCADVVVESRGPSERPAAVAAFKGPVTGVCHHVIPQLRGLREGLRTVSTLIRSGDTQSRASLSCYHGNMTLIINRAGTRFGPSINIFSGHTVLRDSHHGLYRSKLLHE